MYDLDLNLMFQSGADIPPALEVKKLVGLNASECLVCVADGEIVVVNSECMLETVRSGSIFSLKGEDWVDLTMLYIKQSFLVSVETQRIEFYLAAEFKKQDSWDYFFPASLQGITKSNETGRLCVWDANSTLSFFSFASSLSAEVKSRQPPSHKKDDLIQSLEMNSGQVISCSLNRELRIWDSASGKFVKKYDLASFTQETVTTMTLAPNGILFLGAKDHNIYQINIMKGRLNIVYEGHWSRVNIIYHLQKFDIMVTAADSNIKLWDL
jgi:WD40 repeat protein